MGRARTFSLRALSTLAVAFCTTGCIHNHYYGTPGCGEPVAAAPASAYGSVCQVPTRVDGGTATATGPGSQLVSASPQPSRVLVSEPRGDGYPVASGTATSRFGWRTGQASSVATTRIEGAIQSDSVTR